MATYRKFGWMMASAAFASIFTDFNSYAAGDWVITTTEAGTGTATEALAAGAGGLLLVTNAAGDDDKDMFQWAGGSGAVAKTFQFTEGKKLQFVFRGKISDATDTDFHAGLIITDTDVVGGVTDGIYFRKVAASAAMELVIVKDSIATTVTVGDIEDDTFFELEFYYGAAGRIEAFLNGTRVGSGVITNAPDDEALALSFGLQNGAAAAKTMTVDYIGASGER